MKTFYWLFPGILLLLNLSCSNSEKVSEDISSSVIATIGGENITHEELLINFNRNRGIAERDSSALLEFFPSYIEYRLKLYEGYQQGYDNDSTIVAEFNDFASEIAFRYWIENQIKNERIEAFKNRFAHELKAYHILQEVSENASPGTAVEVYNELMAVRDSLMNGASPEEMNERYSSKRDGNPMGGQLSWITAGSTIQPFEDAVYNLEIGEISEPIRTQYGYHLIILQDMRPRTPQRQVKHIFVRKQEDASGSEKINQAYEELEADSSWTGVTHRYSEDPSRVNREGLLGWIGYGTRYPAELIESAMSVSPDRSYSNPIEVSYGYHIFKIDSVRTFSSEEQKEEFIIDRLEQLGRLNPDREDVVDRIAKESDLEVFRDNFQNLLNTPNDSSDASPNLELIRFMDQRFTAADFQNWLNSKASVDEVMQSGDIINSFRDAVIKDHIVDFTRKKFPEFSMEVDHFLHGLIVFKVNEENIWNPDAVDPGQLKAYYESNRDNYKKGITFLYTEISAPTDSLLHEVYPTLTNDTDLESLKESFEELRVRRDSISTLQIPLYETLSNLDLGEFSEIKSVENKASIYLLNDIHEERILGFEEAYDQVFSDYQPIWEEKYLNELKQRYNLELYPENL